jgi:predicted nucleic acid-binding protein
VSYLLDTNAVSEWTKPRPDPGLVQWFDEVDEDRTYLSVITLGELRRGVDRLADGRRRDRLDKWLTNDLPDRFSDRVLLVDAPVADEWGRLLARAETEGRPVAGIDGLIAATAKVHDLQVVTRNVTHFQSTDVTVICPWQD